MAKSEKAKTPNPTQGIFIGIGGTGVITVAHLKSKILQHYGGDKDKMLIDNHFIFLDTDEKTRKEVNQNTKLKSIFKGEPPIDNSEFENLGATKPYQIYYTAKTSSDENSQRLLEWIINPDTQGNYQIPNTELQSGAGAARIAGRTSVYKKWDQIITKINAGVLKMTGYETASNSIDRDKLEDSKPSIWVFGSCNGGTGSSAILDVLYIADRVYQKKFNTDPYLRLILYMPKPFIDANKDNISYSLNAFSTFWELNAFRFDSKNLNDGRKFKNFSCKPDEDGWEGIPGPWNVYSYLLAIDAETDKNKQIKLDDLFINTSEMCYYMHISTAGDTMVSRLDNDIKNTQLINDPRKDTLSDFKWTKSVLAAGYKAICKPDDLLKEYVETRFLYDFYEYGLLGFSFEETHTSNDKRILATKDFADKRIFYYLLKTKEFSAGDESIEKKYTTLFKKVNVQDYQGKEIKDNWDKIWPTFKKQITDTKGKIENAFSDPTDDLSQEMFLKTIKDSIDKGVEDTIRDYGLRYIKGLLHNVDDEYCEKKIGELEEEIPNDQLIVTLEKKINDILEDTKHRDLTALRKNCNEYRELILKTLLYQNTIAILKEMTKLDGGYLEILRRSSNQSKGLTGIITELDTKSAFYSDEFSKLAKKFSDTKNEVFTTFVPDVSDFVNKTKCWKDNNEFEKLYSEIVTLNKSSDAPRLNDNNLGYPPLRASSDNKGLKNILADMSFANEPRFFCKISVNDNYSALSELNNTIKKACDEFIKSKFISNKMSSWLNKSLEEVFDQMYGDEDSKIAFFQSFKQSIPVLYPQRPGSPYEPTERFLFTGANEGFAKKLGYNKDDNNHQYKEEQNISNRFLVFKFETGHNLYDYHGFDDIKTKYYKHKTDIENNVYGCHIHKDFSKLNLNKIVPNVDKNFIEVLLYDAFFTHLATSKQDLYTSLFQVTSSSDGLDDLLSAGDSTSMSTKTDNNITHNPLISIAKNGDNFTIKRQVLKIESHKLKTEVGDTIVLTEIKDFADFFQKTKSNSSIFIELIRAIKTVLDERANVKSEYSTEFSTNYQSIKAKAAQNNLAGASELRIKGFPAHDDMIKELLTIFELIKSKNIFI